MIIVKNFFCHCRNIRPVERYRRSSASSLPFQRRIPFLELQQICHPQIHLLKDISTILLPDKALRFDVAFFLFLDHFHQVQVYQQQLVDAEKKTMSYIKRHNKVQVSFLSSRLVVSETLSRHFVCPYIQICPKHNFYIYGWISK